MRVKRVGYIGTRTADVGAMAEVRAAGLEIVGEPVRAAEAFDDPGLGDFSWFWVRAPDGHIYVIQQVPD